MIRAHISGDHPDKILECLMCGEATADKASFFHHIQTHVYAADNVFYREVVQLDYALQIQVFFWVGRPLVPKVLYNLGRRIVC